MQPQSAGGREEVFETPDVQEDDPEESHPSPATNVLGGALEDGDIDAKSVDPSAAFEVFAGKVFTRSADDGARVGTRPPRFDRVTISVDPDGVGSRAEAPAERYSRLKAEVGALYDDLLLVTRSDKEGEEASGMMQMNEIWKALGRETAALQTELTFLSSNPLYAPIVEPGESRVEDAGIVQKQLAAQVLEKLESIRSAASAGVGKGPGDAAQQSVTYEVFFDGSRGNADEGSTEELERRIHALERGIGGDSMGNVPLVKALQTLEERVDRMSPAKLEVLQKRAALARAELDALAKEKAAVDGLGLPSSGHAQRVDALYDIMKECEGMGGHISTLTQRMTTLQSIHLQSAHFTQRLEQLEQGQSAIKTLLSQTQQQLETVSQTFAKNMDSVEMNMKTLQEKITGVSSS